MKKVLRFMRHPMVVLAVGAALTSWLLPIYSSRTERQRLLHEARLQKAMEIIDSNTETRRDLNRLEITLEMFQKDSSSPAARHLSYEVEQADLRHVMRDQYLEFDKQAWWWYSRLDGEARFLGIASPQELDRLDQISGEYRNDLVETMTTIDNIWDTFLRQNNKPYDPQNRKLVEAARGRLAVLDGDRLRLVMESAAIFAKIDASDDQRVERLGTWTMFP